MKNDKEFIMKKIKKYSFSIIAVVLTLIVGLYYSAGKLFSRKEITSNVRTVTLAETDIDFQALLDEFENGELIQEDNVTTFRGTQALDSEIFEEIDTISENEIEDISNCVVSYVFTYDSDNNVVTISAEMENEYGEIEIDTITGVGFINEQGEIDAVMNVEGEGILLSEMREAGMIQNCGWFSKLVKKVAKVVAVTAVVVAAAAVVVATAGAAAPAVVAAGVGVATTAGVAATIAAYATVTAAIAAGVTITAEMWERYYPGIEVTVTNNIVYASWSDETKSAIKDLIKANRKKSNPDIYFKCEANSNCPYRIDIENPLTYSQMVTVMSTTGMSSLTDEMYDARRVLEGAVPASYPIFADIGVGVPHFQAADIKDPNYNANRGPSNNPRYKVAGKTLHSFWFA